MIIGDRLRELPEQKKLSQGDIEKRTGLLRCYISRVENTHTVPAIETLEKMARHSKFPCTSSSATAKNRLSRRRSQPNERVAYGAAEARMLVSCGSWRACWAK
jgi:transcriptional regulator with XRE-family HTH domain